MVEKHAIDRLKIEGFKSLQNVELELGKLNVLIGPNGSGKSNLVSYFYMLREMVEERLQVWVAKRGGADRIFTYGSKETSQFSSHIKFGDNAYEFVLSQTDVDRFVFADERLFFKNNYPTGYSLGGGHYEAKLKSLIRPSEFYLRMADFCYAAITSWKVYHFHDTGDTARLKRTQALHDNQYLRHDASNLAAYLFMLRRDHSAIYDRICKTVRLAIPFFDDFILEPYEIRPDEYTIQLWWRQKANDYQFHGSQLSDGSIRFICLVIALLQPNPPSTIIFDEPELGLHPYAIALLGSLMRSASQRMQIIVATQSVSLLNEFSIDNLITVERKNGISDFSRIEESEFELWLEEFTVGELWQKNVLGGRMPA